MRDFFAVFGALGLRGEALAFYRANRLPQAALQAHATVDLRT